MGSAYADIGTMRDGNNRIEPGPQRHASRSQRWGFPGKNSINGLASPQVLRDSYHGRTGPHAVKHMRPRPSKQRARARGLGNRGCSSCRGIDAAILLGVRARTQEINLKQRLRGCRRNRDLGCDPRSRSCQQEQRSRPRWQLSQSVVFWKRRRCGAPTQLGERRADKAVPAHADGLATAPSVAPTYSSVG